MESLDLIDMNDATSGVKIAHSSGTPDLISTIEYDLCDSSYM